MKLAKILCALLAAVMLLGVVGCSGGEDKPDVTEEVTTENQGDVTTETPVTTDAPGFKDDVLDLESGLNFKDQTIKLLLRSDRAGAVEEFIAEGAGAQASTLSSAIISRQAYVENELGVTLAFTTTTESGLIAKVRTEVSNATEDYDVICAGANQAPTLAMEGLLCNWYDVPHVNLDKVWWGARSDMAENLTINGVLYMASGDASQLTLGKGLCMYFNQNILKNQGAKISPDDMYDIVSNYEWTIDKLLEITEKYSEDVDGNQDWDSNDLYGCNFYLATIADGYFAAFDIPIVTGDEGDYKIDLNHDRMITAADKLHKMCYEGNRTYLTGDKMESIRFFENRHCVFTHGGMEWATNFIADNMSDDYGIIPYPMFNKAQNKYYSALSAVYTMFLIPKNNKNLEAVGATMELLGAKSYETTTVAYYEIILKGRALKDEKSWTMLDLIHDGLCYEFGFTYSAALGSPANAFRTLLANSSANNWSSFWEKNGSKYNTKLQEMLASYK